MFQHIEFEYGNPIWREDEAAANAEAGLRARRLSDVEDAMQRKAIWFSDLGAMTTLPRELSEIEGLETLHLGYGFLPTNDYQRFSLPRVSDLSLLAEIPSLRRLNLSGGEVSDLHSLSVLHELNVLKLANTDFADVNALSDLAKLKELDLSCTRVREVGKLSRLSELTSLDLSYSDVSDVGDLSELKRLQRLDLSHTDVNELSALRGLNELIRLNMTGTKISDLSVLMELPKFAKRQGEFLRFSETPLAEQNKHWQLLAGLDQETAAKDVVLYLTGEHPDLQPPTEGVVHPSGMGALAQAAPVALAEQDGRAEVVDTAAFQPPQPADHAAFRANLEGVRAVAANLVAELEAEANVHPRLKARVGRYAQAADPVRAPSFVLLESAMVLLRPLIADPYTRDPLDPGLTAGLDNLVHLHDALNMTPAIPDPLPELPRPPETPQDQARLSEAVDQVGALVEQAAAGGLVGNTVVVAVNSTVDVANTANSPIPPIDAKEAAQRKGFWSWATRMAGGLVWAMDQYAKAHGWATTPLGAAIMQKLQKLLEIFATYF